MKNNKTKGFTLVELLVVIAILAILATVSVVGYTSFIENATVSNDNNIATQLNNFLVALKADSNGEYYDELKNGVTADNVIEITNHILSEGGLDSLVPQAEKYGYHYYFDLVGQEYILIADDDDRIDSKSMFSRLIHAEGGSTQTAYPECAITKDARYFLIETGTPLAALIAEFKAITSTEQLNAYFDKVEKYETEAGKQLTGLVNLVKETVFTTNNGHFIVSGTENHKHLFVQNNLVVSNQNNHEKMSINGSTIITKDAPLVTLQKDQTIVLSLADGKTLAKYSFWFGNPEKATLVIDGINTLEELITRVDVDFTNANIVVGGKTYTVSGHAFKDVEGNIVTGTNGEAIAIEEKNKVKSFDYSISNDKANKVDASDYIAIDGGTFTFTADNFKGLLNDEISDKTINWIIKSVYYNENNSQVAVTNYSDYIKLENGKLTITLPAAGTAIPKIDGIVIEAKSVIGTAESAKTITLKVRRPVGVKGLTFGGKPVASGTELNLSNGDAATNKNSAYTINGNYSLVYNYDVTTTNVVVDTISPVITGSTNLKVTNNTTVTLVDAKTELLTAEDLTVNFGDYFKVPFKVSMYDALNLTFSTTNSKVVIVGDDNTVRIDELITLNTGFNVPANAQVWFMKNFSTQYAKPGEITASGFATDNAPDDDANLEESKQDSLIKIELNNDNDWGSTPIQFANGGITKAGAIEVSVVIVVPDASSKTGYRCISQPRTVKIVDGYNIRTGEYSTLKAKADAGSSIVLLGDVKMDVAESYFDILAGKSFYGNCFKLDLSENGYMGGSPARYGIIGLSGAMYDTNIIGKVYGTFAGSANDKFGTNLVGAFDGSIISNCYLSNTRSPLLVKGTVTLDNTVLFGGVYANVDIRDGHLVITGNVTTVQQVVSGLNDKDETVNVIGMGIAGWFEDQAHAVTVSAGANLKQLNFVSEKDKDNLASLNYSGVNLVDLKQPFEALFNNYTNYLFSNKVGDTTTRYAHAGVVSLDKYLFNYSVRGVKTGGGVDTNGDGDYNDSGWYGPIPWTDVAPFYYDQEDKIYITIQPLSLGGNTQPVEVKITYDPSYFRAPDKSQTGTYVTTIPASGAVLEFETYMASFSIDGAVEFLKGALLGIDMGFTIVANDGTSYASMQFTDNSEANAKTYSRVEYKYNIGGIISALADKVGNLHAKGLHSQLITIDVHTYQAKNAQDVENAANKALLQEYLTAVSNGTYLPGTYELTAD